MAWAEPDRAGAVRVGTAGIGMHREGWGWSDVKLTGMARSGWVGFGLVRAWPGRIENSAMPGYG